MVGTLHTVWNAGDFGVKSGLVNRALDAEACVFLEIKPTRFTAMTAGVAGGFSESTD
jgi:hypothetical protein